ncbi:L-seryl-tRNA(Sec) selenium transferase [Rubrobacter xylanophilus DSM 9941]|uniref:L-seryl-tRNA(Sec) selenium transferase n=1 Tax=Rubrobacter xylanophilus TaxID=49319 RepID=UPI001C643099|nr:L-seryl-tRNA(Sec) selenium transferase [Rubrobacter xylanophilus]QYJ15122.1 L-seryl-tRNA(Sec) selenium transferase [Rubrobacter xylanophilus DSM 9941]
MLDAERQSLLRKLPAVDAVLRGPAAHLAERHGRAAATAAVREVLEGLRREIAAGGSPDVSGEAVAGGAARLLSGRRLRRVVNATGVVLHTNLGRAVLSDRAAEAAVRAATRYSNLEYDLSSGRRGSRYDHAVPLLRQLTGAEDALVVNNCAGATLLALSALAVDGEEDPPEVVVSRGQLIEIGGGFRIPEVLELSGVVLREVGTTNRTRISDYERALGERTRAILWVHPSNFEIQGFTESVGISELATLGLPVVADLGSGALVPVGGEPLAQTAVREGAELVLFSGDKLLGGPQAGIAVGSARLVRRMRRHPLVRALRADKLCLAALEATLRAYLEGTAGEEIPAQRMLREPLERVEARARRLASSVAGMVPGLEVEVVPSVARSGGGTLPGHGIPSCAVRVSGMDPEALAARLRDAEPPVVGRVHEGALLLDARTLLPGDEEAVVEALREAAGG